MMYFEVPSTAFVACMLLYIITGKYLPIQLPPATITSYDRSGYESSIHEIWWQRKKEMEKEEALAKQNSNLKKRKPGCSLKRKINTVWIYVHDPLGPLEYCNCIYCFPSMAIKHAKNPLQSSSKRPLMPVISQRVGRKGIHWEMFPCLERNDTKKYF